MSRLSRFDLPAFQNEFPDEPDKESALNTRWNDNINGFTEQTLQNDPWSWTNQPHLREYFNPLTTDVPAGTKSTAITWTAFPRRIQKTFPAVGQRKQWQYADEGPPKTAEGCLYTPHGPRGWQDEYCEWSVTRRDDGKITRVSFTCENREYWYTLWEIDPNRVLEIYRELVGPQVQLEDLYLRHANGIPIVDRETGRPAYNDRNPWNRTTTHGAVHLICDPNALSAEIFLAGQATVLRTSGDAPITDRNGLINCSHYGNANRNSDPTIGAAVNGLVRGPQGPGSGVRISLANPVGLYLQEPAFGRYQLPSTAPAGAKASDYWKVVRGRCRRNDEPIDFILHAVYEVPEAHGFTVSDITIDGFNIDFGAQLAETFHVALAGISIPQSGSPAASFECAKPLGSRLPKPNVLRDVDMLPSAERSGLNMRLEPGTKVTHVGLKAADSERNAEITISGAPGVTLTRTGCQALANDEKLFLLTIEVADDADLGDRGLQLTNPDGSHGPPVYGLLEVVPKGTLAVGQQVVTEDAGTSALPGLAMAGHLSAGPQSSR